MAKIIHTDGACRQGSGGWAYLLDGEVASGHVDNTTNNVMEIFAIYMALLSLPAHTEVLIITDSRLAIGWLRWGWHASKSYIADLVEATHDTIRSMDLKVTYLRIKGHAGTEGNIMVDLAAGMET
jgi:ribonuclease HI